AAVVEALADRAMRAVEEFGQKRLVLAGGVAANSCLRQTLEERCRAAGAELVKPSPVLCTDNAAMIGAAGWYRYLKGQTAGLDLDPSANLKLGDMP
ncbi:MAG: tRNA (adenosine(37)-N6)-threonylcarbamoyltransferase complex transferase subunit TsaD, partial [Lachnospiraceae bacterium]|nr:tRNA (adenosine(37)-N6)-threonylcarbamoyltransferase complex transferase subunit TsaD [Lachnospiraceae bacterium]